MKNTIVGVDLAKNVIQVCVTKASTVISNKEMSPEQFMSWLITNEPVTIVFEAWWALGRIVRLPETGLPMLNIK